MSSFPLGPAVPVCSSDNDVRAAARRSRAALLVLALFLAACAPVIRRSTAPQPLARRLVLALDGVDYRDVEAAKARGLFAAFRPPSRLISTFPSISDIAWHDIFGVQAPRGYQRIFYSTTQNEVVGEPLDAIRPIEFEDRMDMAFGAKFHHLGAYLISNTVARREVDVTVRDFFKISGRSTVYVYNVGPDALQHTRGDLTRYLAHLDAKLIELQTEYQQRTGVPLEIVLLSDHGHNRASDAQFLPVLKSLQARGFRTAESLTQPQDVAFSVDGVTTGFGVFCLPESVDAVAQALVDTEGVDVVTVRVSDLLFVVRRGATMARVERQMRAGGDVYRYVPVDGDPLGYAPLIARMQREHAVDNNGYADAAQWVRYTSTEEYPAAPERIVRGHTVITLNPAPILVSVASGYRVGLGMVSIANRMRPLGGTHGALNASNALGVLMTNFRDTHDDVTSSVRSQLDHFADLGPIQYKTSGARVTNSWLLSRDARSPFYRQTDTTSIPAQSAALEVWLTESVRSWADPAGAFFVEFRRVTAAGTRAELLATSHLPMRTAQSTSPAWNGWIASADGRRYTLSFARFASAPLAPHTTYELRITLDRAPRVGRDAKHSQREIANLTLRTNARGELWPY